MNINLLKGKCIQNKLFYMLLYNNLTEYMSHCNKIYILMSFICNLNEIN